MPIYDSVLETVGNTPLVRLSRIGRDLPCELLAKLEFMNPGGSVKDRIGVRMLLEAEKSGRIKPGDTLDRADQRQHRHRPGDGGGGARATA